jgi:hypothetical protein
MWPTTFGSRLENWNLLRDRCQNLPAQQALEDINCWWFNTPWKPYYLHWDEQSTWPDPWQLLSDNIYCDVARGLGILYTINLLNRKDLTLASLVLTQDGYNLVLCQEEKYILNWEPDSIVNTSLEVKIHRQYWQQQIA